ncbi:hypothetical protein [Cupriavidus sp. IDO]|uniref:hypothetical protein n=1 Tax=Cupriavidus sp. IDO TaxID=1539142 RepID=UPI0005797906|nr:hypothetical protein [Cupriavidus sp. IDO]KWR75121.1 hypothetical protein RM96_34435 [Cupriavidus sp. IDO]
MLTREALCQQLSALADAALNRRAPSRASLIRAHLLSRHRQARALLGRLVLLPFSALSAHLVTEALAVLQELYARKADHLPDQITIRLGRAWQPALEGQDRQRALAAFEWGSSYFPCIFWRYAPEMAYLSRAYKYVVGSESLL